MRHFAIAFMLLAWLPVSAEPGGVVIAEVLPDPGEAREFIELWNQGDAVALAGWAIVDAAGNRFDFGGEQLPAGGRLVVWGGGAATPEGPAWTKSTVWNNGGDTAYLYDGEVLVDAFSYGSAGGPSVPATGESLALVGAAWQPGEPTPGRAPGSQGGSASVEVLNAPPTPAFGDLPGQVAAGEDVTVTWHVSDPNGDAVAWTLHADGAIVAQGTEGDHEIILAAPAQGTWRFLLEAADAVSNATATATIEVLRDDLRVTLPAEGIRFPAIAPDATNVMASAPFTIHNDGSAPITPRIDIADFAGPSSFATQGRLSLLAADTEVAYAAPLTALPQLAPGASLEVTLRIDTVPLPLPAGTYGTTFTVVA